MIFYIFWRMIVFTVWFGVAFALCTVIIAVAVLAIIGAVVYGLVMPSRTVKGQLRTLDLTISEGIAHVRALRPPV